MAKISERANAMNGRTWSRLAPQGSAAYKPSRPVDSICAFRKVGRRFVNRPLLVAGLVAICLGGAVDWFSAGTLRLYVDQDSTASRQEGTVWQHFGVRGNDVVPEIISRDEARFVFPISLRSPHTLLFSAHPEGSAEYQILFHKGGSSRQIAGQKVIRPVSERISLSAGEGELEFIVHGRIAWFDPRLTRQVFLGPVYLGALFALLVPLRNRAAAVGGRGGNWLALGVSTLICLALLEGALRFFALKLPPAIHSARHDLGLFAPDPRWVTSHRYRQRLRPNLNTYCEWEFGDIVRMGFIPPEIFGGEKHRYPFKTDAEGFRNPAVREKIDVAVLGDSFADAMTSPVEESWPARLEQITGQKVQNYGTSGFGPQQELYVLQDYAIHHEPRHVVLAFFAGNDLFDAERFDRWEKAGDIPGEETTGWRLAKNYRRYEMLYLATLGRVALRSVLPPKNSALQVENGPARSRFDRGRFEIPAADGKILRFAIMPPYLQKLADSREKLETSDGWQVARATLLRMKETCERAGSRLTIMFVPAKAGVYWPLVEQSLGAEELQRAIDFSCLYNHMPLRAAEISANRLAQNNLLRDFCVEADIAFLDLTPALEQNAAAGRAVYFADDAHWNAAGHEIAARELAKFLSEP
jgi:hypothetical protein